MKKLKFVFLPAVALLVLGCTGDEPTFNPNKAGIVFVEGKPYRVPLEANYSKQVFKSPNDQGIVKLRNAGLDCRVGDISWMSSQMRLAAQEAASLGDVNLASSIILGAPRKGQIGCAHPLSKKEYEHYKGKQ